MEKQDIDENKKFVLQAFNNAKKIITGKDENGKDITYFDSMIAQRIEGPTNAGSSYNMTKEELIRAIENGQYEETSHPDVQEGCKCFKLNLKGLEGILDINTLPEDTKLFAIDPKKTGKISIGAANVNKKEVEDTYIIIGPEEIDGKQENVVYTFHPGEPVRPSLVDIEEVDDGEILTREEAKKYGFDKVKYMSNEMVQEYQNKHYNKVLEKFNMNDISDEYKLHEISAIMADDSEMDYSDKELVEALANSNISKEAIKQFIDKYPNDVYTIAECYKNDPELIEYISDKLIVCPNISEDSKVFKDNPELKEKVSFKMKGYSDEKDAKVFFAERENKKYEFVYRLDFSKGLYMPGFELSRSLEVEEFNNIQFPIADEENSSFFIEKKIKREDGYLVIAQKSKYFEYEESSSSDYGRPFTDIDMEFEYFKGAKEARQKKLEEIEKRKADQAIRDNKFRSISDLKAFVKLKIKEHNEKQINTKDEERSI